MLSYAVSYGNLYIDPGVQAYNHLKPMRTPSILLFVCFAAAMNGVDFNLRTVDGLGRPLAGVAVEVGCAAEAKEVKSFKYTSGQDGTVRGSYDPAVCRPRSVSVQKQGYQSYFSGFREKYVLGRLLDVQEVKRVALLTGNEQEGELRELLAGDLSAASDKFRTALFYYERQLRASLRNLARDPFVTLAAREILVTIADSADLRLVVSLDTPAAASVLPDRWRYAVATALTAPEDESEWTFLRRCALNEFNDRWVDAGAIQTLKVIASARSESILVEVQEQNTAQAQRVAKALEYVRSGPPALSGPDLQDLGKRAAGVIAVGTWQDNAAPRFNEAGDKALLDFHFQAGSDYLTYTATFHRIGNVWIFRGARETGQAFRESGVYHAK